MTYGPQRSAAGEIESPDVTRRGFLGGGALRSGGGSRRAARRSAGSELELRTSSARPARWRSKDFLNRCIKCGQCMRVCPTNVIQPALLEAGLEGVWTPILNFRVGTSGCQLNCIACGHVCPTAAIRPLSLDEKLGRGEFATAGPIRMGTAFVDRGRCLPWAHGRAVHRLPGKLPGQPQGDSLSAKNFRSFATARARSSRLPPRKR